MKQAFDDLQMVKHENALTEEDIRSALEAYDKEYYNFTISDIEALTDVRIERNRRNGRSQKLHMQYMNMNRQFKVGIGECTNGGRPSGSGTAQKTVYEWRQQHPGGNEKPLQKGDGIDLSHHSQMVGHYTGGAYNGQNTPVTGFERFVGGEF